MLPQCKVWRLDNPLTSEQDSTYLLPMDGWEQWRLLKNRNQLGFIWHLYVDHGVKCRTLINDQSTVEAKRRKYMPMVEFCVKVAIHQLENGRYFTIENPATSKMWYTNCFERLLRHYMVGYGTLDMCAYGLLDPSGYYYYKPTSLVRNFGEALQPVFKRCSNGLGGEKPYHQHQPIEGNAPGYGSRTKLAQIYPYKFCLTLVKTILPIGNVRCLAPAQSGIVIDLLDNFSVEELTSIEKDVRSVYTDSEHIVYSNVARNICRSTTTTSNARWTPSIHFPMDPTMIHSNSTCTMRLRWWESYIYPPCRLRTPQSCVDLCNLYEFYIDIPQVFYSCGTKETTPNFTWFSIQKWMLPILLNHTIVLFSIGTQTTQRPGALILNLNNKYNIPQV